MDCCDVKESLYHRADIHPEFHDPYIVHGYRKPNISFKESFKHSFIASCNECFNIWSHGLTFAYFVCRFVGLFYYEQEIWNPLFWPLVSLQVGILVLFFMSTFAHTFNSMSRRARHKCFYLDYAGISIYSLGTGQAFYYYCRAMSAPPPYLESPYLFFSVSIASSVMSTIFMCSTRRKWCSAKALLRTLSCVIPFLVNSFPLFQRLYLCSTNHEDCDVSFLPIFFRHTAFLVLGAIANVSKFPEYQFPGKFDAFGQSHHFLHVFITLACQTLYDFVFSEMSRRKSVLETQELQPDAINCLLIMSIGVSINLSIALIFQCDDENKNDSNVDKKEN